MKRAVLLLPLAILTGALAVFGIACDQLHYDIHLGTDAGEGFDAPAREVGGDGSNADAGVVDDAGAVDDAGL